MMLMAAATHPGSDLGTPDIALAGAADSPRTAAQVLAET
jgi:hypothetical protein